LELKTIAGVKKEEFASILVQGSGTYCVEAVLQTVIPKSGGNVSLIRTI